MKKLMLMGVLLSGQVLAGSSSYFCSTADGSVALSFGNGGDHQVSFVDLKDKKIVKGDALGELVYDYIGWVDQSAPHFSVTELIQPVETGEEMEMTCPREIGTYFYRTKVTIEGKNGLKLPVGFDEEEKLEVTLHCENKFATTTGGMSWEDCE